MLYIVPTPIGNLKDFTFRAVEILKEVDIILAEDTRTSKKLLNEYQISTPLRPFHMHNEHKIIESIIEDLKMGQTLALISDAGTPGISDPGFLLSRSARDHDIEVCCLPGATACIPALVNSGLPSDKFHFEGFLPHKKGKQTRIIYLSELSTTFVLYESPHRIIKTIQKLMEYCGEERPASLSRELSKMHEENIRGSLKEIETKLLAKPSIKGEIVLVVGGI